MKELKNYEVKEMEVKRKKRKGFTLIELVIVVAIIAILALIGANAYKNITESSRVSTFESNHDVLRGAISMYVSENGGKQPGSLEDVKDFLDLPNPMPTGTGGNAQTVAEYYADRPQGATYSYANGVLTSTLLNLTNAPKGTAAGTTSQNEGKRAGVWNSTAKSYTLTSTQN